MITEEDILVIKGLISEQLTNRITQMMIPSGTIKQRHIGEGVPLLRSGIAADLPTEGELEGATYFATDTNVLYLWNGTSWVSETFT